MLLVSMKELPNTISVDYGLHYQENLSQNIAEHLPWGTTTQPSLTIPLLIVEFLSEQCPEFLPVAVTECVYATPSNYMKVPCTSNACRNNPRGK